jgi:hypothetical protein
MKSDRNDALAAAFPLCALEDFDFVLPEPWPIGLRKTYPLELKKRVIAASTSLFMRLKSADRVRKEYGDSANYETDSEDRLDLRIDRAVNEDLERLSIHISTVSEHSEDAIGRIMSEWTFARIPFAIRMFRDCANKGGLYEPIAIARMLVEQIAWATKVRSMEVSEDVKNTSAQSSISDLKKISSGAGRLYGWMSEHAHWAYNAHIKSMFFSPRLGLQMASYEYRAKNYALLIILTVISAKSFMNLSGTFSKWGEYKLSTESIRLMAEIVALSPTDGDIKFFASLLNS